MIASALFGLTLLVGACGLFILPAWRRGRHPVSRVTRDTLNTRFYHHRLDELAHDEAEGVVDHRNEHILELRQALLSDVPPAAVPAARPLSLWLLTPGIIVLLAVTAGLYLLTGGAAKQLAWQQTVSEMPALRMRIMDAKAPQLSADELARFAIGLRAGLLTQPENKTDWLILGRIGAVMNDVATATGAFERAWQFDPDDAAVTMEYAQVLIRSNDAGDNQQGIQLLRRLVATRPGNLQAMSLLAYGEYTAENYPRAIALWQQVLDRLPTQDSHAVDIRQALLRARQLSGQKMTRLNLQVSLLPGIEYHLPRPGRILVSVTDGMSSTPVAVKSLPLSRFPLSLSLDDSDAMLPERLLSAQKQVKVRVRISSDGRAEPEAGEWYGESALQDFNDGDRIQVQLDRQVSQ